MPSTEQLVNVLRTAAVGSRLCLEAAINAPDEWRGLEHSMRSGFLRMDQFHYSTA